MKYSGFQIYYVLVHTISIKLNLCIEFIKQNFYSHQSTVSLFTHTHTHTHLSNPPTQKKKKKKKDNASSDLLLVDK